MFAKASLGVQRIRYLIAERSRMRRVHQEQAKNKEIIRQNKEIIRQNRDKGTQYMDGFRARRSHIRQLAVRAHDAEQMAKIPGG